MRRDPQDGERAQHDGEHEAERDDDPEAPEDAPVETKIHVSPPLFGAVGHPSPYRRWVTAASVRFATPRRL